MKNSEKWYCSLPWTGFSNDPDGKVRPCCLYKDYIKDESGNVMYVQKHSMEEIFHSKFMINLRQEFREGKKPLGCNTCIMDEKNGHRSKRQIYTRNKDQTHDSLVNFDDEPEYPNEFQVIISNACNLKCRSCTPSHSNLWQAEFKRTFGHTGYDMPYGQSGDKNGLFWKNRKQWYSTIKNLEIVGGEPFYIQQWNEIWEEMIELGFSKNIQLSMSSNSVIYSGDRLKRLTENFSFVGIGLSIDGMGKVYNYLRHPGKWEEVSENIIKYSNLRKDYNLENLDISISHTISWLNVYWIPELKQWLDQNTYNLKFWYNLIHSPEHMALWALPYPAKDVIREKLIDWAQDSNEVNGIINHMYSRDISDDNLKDLYHKFKIHDKARNEDLKNIIPNELMPYIEHLINNS